MEFKEKVTEISKKIGKGAEKAYKAVAEKSNKIIDDTKNKIEISTKEDEILDVFQNIGKTVYDKYVKKQDKFDFSKECNKIDKIKLEICKLEEKILDNKNLKKCKKCETLIDAEAKFCFKCGDKQKAPAKKVKKEELKECSKCKKTYTSEYKFCPDCGEKNEN